MKKGLKIVLDYINGPEHHEISSLGFVGVLARREILLIARKNRVVINPRGHIVIEVREIVETVDSIGAKRDFRDDSGSAGGPAGPSSCARDSATSAAPFPGRFRRKTRPIIEKIVFSAMRSLFR